MMAVKRTTKTDDMFQQVTLSARGDDPEAMKEVLAHATRRADFNGHLERAEAAAVATLEEHGTDTLIGKDAESVLHWLNILRTAIRQDNTMQAASSGFYLAAAAERIGVRVLAPAVVEGKKSIKRRQAGATANKDKWAKRHEEWQRLADDIHDRNKGFSKKAVAIAVQKALEKSKDQYIPSVRKIQEHITIEKS